jgi:hypothetical protein
VSNAGSIASTGSLVFRGSQLDNAGEIRNDGGLLAHELSHVVQQSGASIQNSGEYRIGTGSSISGDGSYVQTEPDASTQLDGTLGGASVDIQGGALGGGGVVDADLRVGSAATLHPGNSPGTLHVAGDLDFQGGTLEIEIDGPAAFDVLDVGGAAAFTGGDVHVNLSQSPAPGAVFDWLVAAGGITGAGSLEYGFTGPHPGVILQPEQVGSTLRLRTVPDRDDDGVADASDNCPYFASPSQADADGDGRGDACECSDQNGDGRNTVADLVAINRAIFTPALATPLCDGNGDGRCNVNDIVAANVEIFSPTSTSTCGRQPVPGP